MALDAELQLVYRPRPQRPVCARLLPGDDAETWLAELAGWDVPRDKVGLYVVPRSRRDLHPCGLLVTCADGGGFGDAARGQPYGVIAKNLFVPVDAAFNVELTDAEWRTLLGADYVAYVWHPVVGLVGFEPGDRLSVSDLIQLSAPRGEDWDRAEPGPVINSRLVSIVVQVPPNADQILEAGRDGIGTESNGLRKSPFSWGELPSTFVRGAAGATFLPVFLAAAWMKKLLTAGGTGQGGRSGGGGAGAKTPNWLQGFESWMARLLQQSKHLWDAREREIKRLMQKLEDDPDEGLKFAIPMGGPHGGQARGLAPPSAWLSQRLVDFSLSHFGGGGMVDYWDLPPQMQFDLTAKYRALAEREVRLGRHRRAAYIFASLLGDLSAAASTLVNGGHFREAAVLYRDKLNRPADAASCLERGGLLHEAIPIYEGLKQFVKVGDLYTLLEQPEEAEHAYRQAVDERLQHGDYLAAAKLLDTKLSVFDEAVATLRSGWSSAQGRACADEAFRLLAREGEHELARECVAELRLEMTLLGVVAKHLILIESLAEAAVRYPDVGVRSSAADSVRVVASKALVDCPTERKLVLRAVERLVPEDRLLARDCLRYAQPQNQRLPPPAPGDAARSLDRSSLPRLVRTIQLPGNVEWSAAAATEAGFYVVGGGVTGTVLVRGAWDARESYHQTSVSWGLLQTEERAPALSTLLSVDPAADPAIRLFIPGKPALRCRLLPPTAEFPSPQSAVTPGWLGDDVVGMHSADGMTWVFAKSSMVVQGYNRDGLPVANRRLSDDLISLIEAYLAAETAPEPLPVHAREDAVYVGVGTKLFRLAGVDHVESLNVDGTIQAIVGSGLYTRARIAVFLDRGGFVHWPGTHLGDKSAVLPRDLESPRGVFLRDGRLVVCTSTDWLVYSTQDGKLQLKGEMPATKGAEDVFQVLQTDKLNEFATVSTKGQFAIYQMGKLSS